MENYTIIAVISTVIVTAAVIFYCVWRRVKNPYWEIDQMVKRKERARHKKMERLAQLMRQKKE